MPRVIRRRRRAERRLPDGFMSCLVLMEEGKEQLLAAVPTARRRGLPPAEAVLGFELCLREAQAAMKSWRDDRLEAEWVACSEALEESLRRAQRLRMEAPDLEFESLLAAVGDLIDPLDAFGAAAERLRRPFG
jgi:hypothetical protein